MSSTHSSRLRPAIEIVVIAAIFFAVRELAGSLPYPSQIAEVVCLVVISVLLNMRGTGWRDLGFRLPGNWLKAIGLTILCVVTIGLVFNFVIQPLFPQGANEINDGKAISFTARRSARTERAERTATAPAMEPAKRTASCARNDLTPRPPPPGGDIPRPERCG